MRVLYIPQWDDHFEISQSRKIKDKPLHWVAIKTRHDGSGFRRVASQPEPLNATTFAAFVLLVQIAARCPKRGVLAKDGRALDFDDFALRTGFSAQMFEDAVNVLVDKRIGWVAWGEYNEQEGLVSECNTTALPLCSHSAPTTLPPQDKTRQDKETSTPKGGRKSKDYPPDFETFWKSYTPRNPNDSKRAAFGAWKQMVKGDVNAKVVMDAHNRCRPNDRPKNEHQFIPHAATWLRKAMWEVEPELPLATKPTGLAAFRADLKRAERESGYE